jgi:F-type H+-transporting ATPase subunit beta
MLMKKKHKGFIMNKSKLYGKVLTIIGPVVDVKFDEKCLPEILTALTLTNPVISDKENNLTLEVAQHLGNFVFDGRSL